MPAFYADVMKMKPEGKLGQVIKQEKIDTSIKGAQAWKIAYISSDVGGRTTFQLAWSLPRLLLLPKKGAQYWPGRMARLVLRKTADPHR
jgi:hypothetical protein